MRILLVYPTGREGYRKGFSPPLSPAQIAAITPERHEVVIVNDAIEDIPFDGDFDLVGVTSLTSLADRTYEICEEFMKRGVPTVVGGIHGTILPEETLEHCDAVVTGDAELIWEQVLGDCESGKMQGIYNGPAFDLQTEIHPRWDLFDLDRYMHIPWIAKPIMPIYTTKGCPYGCEYCTVTMVHGKTYRHRPVAHVLRELEMVGMDQFFFFVDDNIVAEPDYAEELFAALKGKNVSWFGQASTTILKRPGLIQKMADAGCASVFIGIESIDPDSLQSVRKGFNRSDKYTEVFDQFYRAGVIPYTSFMFGFDPDTREAFPNTLAFLRLHNIMLSAWWILTPVPETPLEKKMKADCRIIDPQWSHRNGTHVTFQPKNFTPEELQEDYWKYVKLFYSDIGKVNNRVRELYPNIRQDVYLGSRHMQGVAKHQVMNEQHVFDMGIK